MFPSIILHCTHAGCVFGNDEIPGDTHIFLACHSKAVTNEPNHMGDNLEEISNCTRTARQTILIKNYGLEVIISVILKTIDIMAW